uniref:Uncharacterized protein n=1 Tax=Arcella intermedia TaxID=1963864 RepID=A0A6B2LPE0_9EUKA
MMTLWKSLNVTLPFPLGSPTFIISSKTSSEGLTPSIFSMKALKSSLEIWPSLSTSNMVKAPITSWKGSMVMVFIIWRNSSKSISPLPSMSTAFIIFFNWLVFIFTPSLVMTAPSSLASIAPLLSVSNISKVCL